MCPKDHKLLLNRGRKIDDNLRPIKLTNGMLVVGAPNVRILMIQNAETLQTICSPHLSSRVKFVRTKMEAARYRGKNNRQFPNQDNTGQLSRLRPLPNTKALRARNENCSAYPLCGVRRARSRGVGA
jgi:hypothetical protein